MHTRVQETRAYRLPSTISSYTEYPVSRIVFLLGDDEISARPDLSDAISISYVWSRENIKIPKLTED